MNITTWVQVGKYFGKMTGIVQVFANMAGALFTTFYFTFLDTVTKTGFSLLEDIYTTIIIFLFLVVIGFLIYTRWFEDIANYIRMKIVRREPDEDLQARTQKKVLNVPFATSAVSMFNWTLAAIIVTTMTLMQDGMSSVNSELALNSFRLFTGILGGGIITSAVIFFVMENYCRKYLHLFFPKGGLVNVKGVFRLNLRLRILMTFVFASFIPITDVAVLSYSKAKMMLVADPAQVLSSLGVVITFALVVDLSLAFFLSHLLARIIVSPVNEMKRAMERVEKGDLTARVRVCDNNELGILGNNFNKMTEGLRDRYHMRQSLAMAREVQQDLLPKNPPAVEGLDIAGRIIYSDETGGDYYDYIYPIDPMSRKIGIAVGDVSEHGIPSAILMASTRAFIRQRAALEGGIATLINDVNFQFTRDVEDSGRFMTLFFLSIEYGKNVIEWVRAGHDAALFYDPASDAFEELLGEGLALGINGGHRFHENIRHGFEKGQIIVMGTDGLWEAVNPHGEMFGKNRLRDLIRQTAGKSAREIVDDILESVEVFSETRIPEDDITLVVIKRT